MAWEVAAGRFFLLQNLHKMGDFVKLKAYAERFRREAEQRGNIYLQTTISRLCNILWLVADDPAGARTDLEAGAWAFSLGYHVQHWHELSARVDIAIYEGSSIDRKFFSEQLTAVRRSAILRVIGYRCETAWMIGRMALAEGCRGRLKPAHRSGVDREAVLVRDALHEDAGLHAPRHARGARRRASRRGARLP
ncbi:MAG TPA: hypothetical protein VHT91_38735 [Kofleriaceae bacterium]|nr:hypothetical protein [Kofleriaceae bacterium]